MSVLVLVLEQEQVSKRREKMTHDHMFDKQALTEIVIQTNPQ